MVQGTTPASLAPMRDRRKIGSMLKCLIALTSLLSAAALAAPAWTWVDGQGRRHYSDTPVEGATQIELAGSQTFTTGTAARPAAQPQTQSSEQQTFSYSVVDIISPAPQETLNNVGGNLEVEVATYPPLRSSDHLDAILDGERIALGARSLTLTVPNVERGEHTLQVIVSGANGEQIKGSLPITFFVRQNSAVTPPPARSPARPSLVPSNTGPPNQRPPPRPNN